MIIRPSLPGQPQFMLAVPGKMSPLLRLTVPVGSGKSYTHPSRGAPAVSFTAHPLLITTCFSLAHRFLVITEIINNSVLIAHLLSKELMHTTYLLDKYLPKVP